MKFMIGVDCDGSACVVGQPGRSLTHSCDLGFAQAQATRETDAAARALFDAGAEKVVVWDNHGYGTNLQFHELDPRCEVVLGTGFGRRWPGLDETYAGVVMIGYHTMEGTPGGVLAHTYSPHAYRRVTVNGREVGEIAIDAAVAGAIGVPLLFVASDDHGCEEAKRFMPWVETTATKRGVGAHAAFSKHPSRAAEEIYEGVGRAVARIGEMGTFTFSAPVQVEIRFKHAVQALKARLRHRGWRMAGPRTVRRRMQCITEWAG